MTDRLKPCPDVIHVLFDGPPGPVAGRFVECENPDGRSINAGEWHERADGYWELRISLYTHPAPATDTALVEAALKVQSAFYGFEWPEDFPEGERQMHRQAMSAALAVIQPRLDELQNVVGCLAMYAPGDPNLEFVSVPSVLAKRAKVVRARTALENSRGE